MKKRSGILCIILAASILFLTASCSLRTPGPTKDYSTEAVELSSGGRTKYHFSLLNNTEKHAYNNILSSVKDFVEKIEIPVLSEESLNKVYSAILYDNPELFFLRKTCSAETYADVAYFKPQYSMSLSDYTAMIGKCTAVADEIIKKTSECTTDFDKERVVHDEIISLCSYSDKDDNAYKNSIYGVLVYRSASCEGYSKTAKYLFDLLGIESYVITGSSYGPSGETQPHMWNIINLEGNYYHLDLTWDDPVTESSLPTIFYTYFNVTDEVIGKTHFDFDNANLCLQTEGYFFNHTEMSFESFGRSAKEKVALFAADIINKGSNGFQICFSSESAFKEAADNLFEKQEIYNLLESIESLSAVDFATDRVSYVLSENYNIIEVIIETV